MATNLGSGRERRVSLIEFERLGENQGVVSWRCAARFAPGFGDPEGTLLVISLCYRSVRKVPCVTLLNEKSPDAGWDDQNASKGLTGDSMENRSGPHGLTPYSAIEMAYTR